MKSSEQPRAGSAKILAFDGLMGSSSHKKSHPAPPPAPPPVRSWWHRHRDSINVGSTIVYVLTTIIAFGLTIYWHGVATQTTNSDEHVNQLIDNKLVPILQQLQTLNAQVSDALGQLKRIDDRVKTLKPNSSDLLANNISAGNVLAGIQTRLANAEKHRQKLTVPELFSFKKQVQSVPASVKDYWTTVAAIINYQSFLIQLEHNAPDPNKVAKACLFATESPNVRDNVLAQTQSFTNCYVDLDTNGNLIENAVVKDSVVRYHGGRITFLHAVFINCRFVVNIKAPKEPTRPDLLIALLNSDQINFTLPNPG